VTDGSLADDDIKIFDSWTDTETLCSIDSELYKILLMNLYPEIRSLSAMHTSGECILNCVDKVVVERVLFDTGSLSANYVSLSFIQRYKNQLKSKPVKYASRVYLASRNNMVEATEAITLILHFKSNNKVYSLESQFIILDMDHNDIIIGLPDIIGKLYSYFLSLLEDARSKLLSNPVSCKDTNNAILCFVQEGEILEPFQFTNLLPAPEEELTPDPVNFRFALNYLEQGHDEAVREFHEQILTRVSDIMQRETNVMELLRTVGVKVFVPQNWEGIKGIPPLELKWKPNLPDRIKPKARPINPKIWETAKKEVNRLLGYFYRKSRSPIASPLVFAPKATKPFIRCCGDYVAINQFIETGHYWIPNVQHELDKIINYKLFVDIDMTNAFHQVPLAPKTSERLSVQTPWGQFEPLFMPEGIGPGSFILQETVRDIFSDFDEWIITIFDNLLILAHTPQDAYNKLEIFLHRCIQHNVILKMSKSTIGYETVTFFGYCCQHNSYEISKERKHAVMDIPFPEGKNKVTQMRRALGIGVFFKPFIAYYSDVTAPLTDMTKLTFNWDETTWTRDYRKDFENFKLKLQEATAVYFPDYTKEWILRTDASEVGVGAVLLQIIYNKEEKHYQPIAFLSHKFSVQAKHWTTIEQEAFAIYYAVLKLSYYLIGKEFVLETDHNNLLWIEASMVPKVVRWRIYLQSFNFKIRHISGKRNLVADWLSRLHEDPIDTSSQTTNLNEVFHEVEFEDTTLALQQLLLLNSLDTPEIIDDPDLTATLDTTALSNNTTLTPHMAFREIHNAKVGHAGARLSWHRLNKYFPGHGMSLQTVADLVSECPTCLKTRATLEHALQPIIRHLKPAHHRSVLGIDSLEITPNGKKGETHLLVCVNLFTKHTFLLPTIGCTAVNLCHAVWLYWCNFGTTDMIISDKGPDLNSEMFNMLKAWIGVRHQFSITNQHVNGVERILKEINRHLRAIVFDTRITDVFDDPIIIPAVQYVINSEVNSETGFSPFELLFGLNDFKYFHFTSDQLKNSQCNFVNHLQEQLAVIRQISYEHQQKLAAERVSKTPHDRQNKYQPGDYVLFDQGPKPSPKLSHRYKGPYEVIDHVKNDVTCRHLVMGNVEIFDVESLLIFTHDYHKAYQAALRDYNQYEIDMIIGHKGNPERRTTMEFLIKFKDEDIKWVKWSQDLFQSIPYESYVSSIRCLHQLKYTEAIANKWKRSLNQTDIDFIFPGQIVYVELQWLGYDWFSQLNLPDIFPLIYVLETKLLHWYYKNSHKKLSVQFTIFPIENIYVINHSTAYAYFSNATYDVQKHLLVDSNFVKKYPDILK
jgi:hypothetical protein